MVDSNINTNIGPAEAQSEAMQQLSQALVKKYGLDSPGTAEQVQERLVLARFAIQKLALDIEAGLVVTASNNLNSTPDQSNVTSHPVVVTQTVSDQVLNVARLPEVPAVSVSKDTKGTETVSEFESERNVSQAEKMNSVFTYLLTANNTDTRKYSRASGDVEVFADVKVKQGSILRVELTELSKRLSNGAQEAPTLIFTKYGDEVEVSFVYTNGEKSESIKASRLHKRSSSQVGAAMTQNLNPFLDNVFTELKQATVAN